MFFSLERMDAGDFGYCQECGEEIELSRLRATPTASLCVNTRSHTLRWHQGAAVSPSVGSGSCSIAPSN
ncbi:MAG: TraR/DksA family transcriptional regulator [Syntrophobacteraceae bacterium]